ncbi:MAG: hypothetical protein MUF15_19630 [Acidobacteria bacterium]|jgi:hypothetical protein|nr:hypothetical protein [Acidobacteriota bacterium]
MNVNKWRLMFAVLILGFFAASSSHFQDRQGRVSPLEANNGLKPANVKVEKDYGKMPLVFIPNKGQMDKQVYFYIQGKDKTVYFTPKGVTYVLNASGGSLFEKSSAKTFVKEKKLKNSSKLSSQ